MIPIPTRQSEPPKGDLLGAGRGRPDAGHGLRASDQEDHRADQAGQTGEHQDGDDQDADDGDDMEMDLDY